MIRIKQFWIRIQIIFQQKSMDSDSYLNRSNGIYRYHFCSVFESLYIPEDSCSYSNHFFSQRILTRIQINFFLADSYSHSNHFFPHFAHRRLKYDFRPTFSKRSSAVHRVYVFTFNPSATCRNLFKKNKYNRNFQGHAEERPACNVKVE